MAAGVRTQQGRLARVWDGPEMGSIFTATSHQQVLPHSLGEWPPSPRADRERPLPQLANAGFPEAKSYSLLCRCSQPGHDPRPPVDCHNSQDQGRRTKLTSIPSMDKIHKEEPFEQAQV